MSALCPVICVGALLMCVLFIVIYIHLGTRAMLQRRGTEPDVNHSERYSPPYEAVTFRSRDGLQLFGTFFPVQGTGARGTIIFCHGQAGSSQRDASWVSPFHDAGFNVFMFDFRGHGRSEGNLVTLGYLERLDMLGALDYLTG